MTTFEHEDQLPRVPLPTVEESCDRFLEWCAPLLDAEEFDRTAAAVEQFRAPDSPAHRLHQALQEYDAREDVHSWLDEFWRDRYLGRRDPIAINANYCFLFRPPHAPVGQARRAAELITGAVAHKLDVDAERFPVTTRRGKPLSMVQHKHLFSTIRLPGTDRDSARMPYTAEHPGPSTARHVVVLVRGAMVRLEVIGADGVPHTTDELTEALDQMLADIDHGQGIGRLTTLPRAEWAVERERLRGVDPANDEALEVIETALFAVCLDGDVEDADQARCRALLIGDAANRWFDIGISWVVLADGSAGINAEHALVDGTTMIELLDDVLTGPAAEHERRSGARPQGAPAWEPVEFVVDAPLAETLDRAGEAFVAAGEAVALRLVTYPVGSDRAKQLGLSPDAFFQLAFQRAQQRSRGGIGPTYESVSTRGFHHGRTEAMRVVTPEIVTMLTSLDDPGATPEQRAAAIRAAADAHVRRARDCQAGAAPEQHLWELQMIQRRQGSGPPLALYDSPGWLRMRDDDLSTSAVPSPKVVCFGFGATSEHCIGIGYVPGPDALTVYFSTPSSVAEGLDRFAAALGPALTELAELLEKDPDQH